MELATREHSSAETSATFKKSLKKFFLQSTYVKYMYSYTFYM